MKKLFIVALTCTLLLTHQNQLLAETKVATIDINKVLNESTESKKRRKELDSKAEDLKKKIDTRKAKLSELEKQLKDKKVADGSPEAEQLRSEARSLERFVRDSDEDLKKEFFKLNRALTEKVLAAVNSYASEQKLDLVLDKSESARGIVLYGKDGVDITEEILKKVNSL